MATRRMEEWNREDVYRVSRIIGDSAAATAALKHLDERRAAGEDVAIYRSSGAWFVGPRLAAKAVPKGS